MHKHEDRAIHRNFPCEMWYYSAFAKYFPFKNNPLAIWYIHILHYTYTHTARVIPLITSIGSITFPSDLLILRPWASRTIAWRYTWYKLTSLINTLLGNNYLFEGNLPHEFHPKHYHTSNPKKQDVMSSLQQTSRIKHFKVICL